MYSLYVEKKNHVNYEAINMLNEVINYLKINTVKKIRVINGYHIEGIDMETFTRSKWVVFAEKGLDELYETKEDVVLNDADFILTTEFLPGQYDQRSDFAMQQLKLLNPKEFPIVKTFKCIAFYGKLSNKEIEVLQSYYVNPVECRIISLNNQTSINQSQPEPLNVLTIKNFNNLSHDELNKLKKEYAIELSFENLAYCQQQFLKEGKEPTVTELKILDTYWSDHCRHSTFLTELNHIDIEKSIENKGLEDAVSLFWDTHKQVYNENNRPLCLMDIATMEMKKLKKIGKLNDLEDSEEINACSIEVKGKIDEVEEDFLILFKNETHNHPTEIEPFGGASTCIGGGIRDPLSGRAFVFGAIRVVGSGDPREDYYDTIPDKLPQRKISKTAAEGYSSYANQIGLGAGQLLEFYDDGFKAKRMECGALVAYALKKNVTRGKAQRGDVIILLGGNTGRDGVGGATGSSKQQDNQEFAEYSSEVQKGNPVIERNIVRLFRNSKASKMIKKCNDFGAGGVAVAVGELADSLFIDLDKVPLKYQGLNATEVAISESQERMAVLICSKDLEEFSKLANEENLNAVKIAVVTEDGRIRMSWQGIEVANIESSFLNSGGIRKQSDVKVCAPTTLDNKAKLTENLQNDWLSCLGSLNNCSKKCIANRFDSTSNNVSMFLPFGGVEQQTPELGLAMKVPLLVGATNLGTLMTVGYNPALCYKNPFNAALYAVIESVVKIVAMGGDYSKVRLSFQEYFESVTNNPEGFGKAYASLMGAFLAQEKLGIPSIGGKDSMSGTYKEISVPPSLISFAIVTVNTEKIVSRNFKAVGSYVYLLKTPIDESGLPDFEVLKSNMTFVHGLIQKEEILSSSNLGSGGIVTAISEMSFGNKIGFSFSNQHIDLFEDNYTDFILETSQEIQHENIVLLGKTTKEQQYKMGETIIQMDKALDTWQGVLKDVFPTNLNSTTESKIKSIVSLKNTYARANIIKKHIPSVLIPIFPGTNCEYEMEKQFYKAGAIVKTVLFKNRTKEDIYASFEELNHQMNQCDVLAIPSGMSAGSEPDGASKIISLILQENHIKEALNNLIEKRKGLVLGFGEAFKSLVKLGLIQNGFISEKENDYIVITKNTLNQYQSQLVRVKIINPVYPWFGDDELDNIEILPVSTLEGAIILTEDDYLKYLANGQIVSKYVDTNNNFTMQDAYNPFGSSYGIEGMVSKNGQVFGRVGLGERVEKGLYQNVANIHEPKIFKNIVSYFS